MFERLMINLLKNDGEHIFIHLIWRGYISLNIMIVGLLLPVASLVHVWCSFWRRLLHAHQFGREEHEGLMMSLKVQVPKRVNCILVLGMLHENGKHSYELSDYPGHWHRKVLQQEEPQHNLCLTSVVKARMLMVGDHQMHSLASTEVTCLRMWAWKHLLISTSSIFSVSHSGLLKGVILKLLWSWG